MEMLAKIFLSVAALDMFLAVYYHIPAFAGVAFTFFVLGWVLADFSANKSH